MMQCHWVNGWWCLDTYSGLIFKSQNVQEEHSGPWRWDHYIVLMSVTSDVASYLRRADTSATLLESKTFHIAHFCYSANSQQVREFQIHDIYHLSECEIMWCVWFKDALKMAALMKCIYKGSSGFIVNIKRIKEDIGSHMWGSPHMYSFTFSFNCTVNNWAVRSRVCWKFRVFVQLKFLDCVTFKTAEDLTAQFMLDCSVCCVFKAEAQFVYIFNAVNIT